MRSRVGLRVAVGLLLAGTAFVVVSNVAQVSLVDVEGGRFKEEEKLPPEQEEISCFWKEAVNCKVFHHVQVNATLPKVRPSRQRKRIELTFESVPADFAGKKIDGWPPHRSRNVASYICPGNPHTFPIEPKLKSSSPSLVVMVHSSVANGRMRHIIRNNWAAILKGEKILFNKRFGHRLSSDPFDVSVIFLVGAPTGLHSVKLQDSLEKEAGLYGDILQADVIDTYNNLTLKSLMMLKFFTDSSRWKSQPRLLLKMDDDIFLNPLPLEQILRHSANIDNFIFGTVYSDRPPFRNESHRYFTPMYLFDGRKFPTFVSGTFYLMDIHIARCSYCECMSLPLFHLEDVFVTGFCAQECGHPRYLNTVAAHPMGLKKGAVSAFKHYDVYVHRVKTPRRFEELLARVVDMGPYNDKSLTFLATNSFHEVMK